MDKINEYTIEQIEGYLGSAGFKGSKSDMYLFGGKLSKAIRDALKECGIKGVSVSCKTYSGGQSVTLKVKVQEGDVKSIEDMKKYDVWDIVSEAYWIHDSDNNVDIHREKFVALPRDEQERIVEGVKKSMVEHAAKGMQLNHYHMDEDHNKAYTPKFLSRVNKAIRIAQAFNRDESNLQADYFDVNFYLHVESVA